MRKLVLAVAVLVPSVALGQVRQEPDKVVVQRKTVIDINDHELSAGRDLPSGSYKVVPADAKFPSLIQLRMDFNPELQGSVDALH